MAFLSHIKKDRDFYQGLSALLKVLKGIAISQFHILERKVSSFDKFSQAVENFLKGVDVRRIKHPFLQPQNSILGAVAITSDAGLLGGLNISVVNRALEEIGKEGGGRLIIVGERGKLYAREKGIGFAYMEGIKDNIVLDQAISMCNYLIKEIFEDNLGKVRIVYPHAYSLMLQRVEVVSLLPYGSSQEEKHINIEDFILESPLYKVVEYLVYLWMGKRIYEIFMMSRLAEFAARFVHLEECTQKLEDVDKQLRLKYFRLRHELMDRSMRELFAARMIFK